MYISVIIRQRSGRVVKSFHLTGIQIFDKILLWIWRDLFISFLSVASDHQRQRLPNMLREIEDALGWVALERLLVGGSACENISAVLRIH